MIKIVICIIQFGCCVAIAGTISVWQEPTTHFCVPFWGKHLFVIIESSVHVWNIKLFLMFYTYPFIFFFLENFQIDLILESLFWKYEQVTSLKIFPIYRGRGKLSKSKNLQKNKKSNYNLKFFFKFLNWRKGFRNLEYLGNIKNKMLREKIYSTLSKPTKNVKLLSHSTKFPGGRGVGDECIWCSLDQRIFKGNIIEFYWVECNYCTWYPF